MKEDFWNFFIFDLLGSVSSKTWYCILFSSVSGALTIIYLFCEQDKSLPDAICSGLSLFAFMAVVSLVSQLVSKRLHY